MFTKLIDDVAMNGVMMKAWYMILRVANREQHEVDIWRADVWLHTTICRAVMQRSIILFSHAKRSSQTRWRSSCGRLQVCLHHKGNGSSIETDESNSIGLSAA